MSDNARMTRTDPAVVAGQATAIADAWSPPDAPQSWWLTSATFAAIAREDVLLELAAEIPPDRLPPLLLAAVLRYLVGAEPDAPIARHYPVPGGEQPPPDPAFGAELAAFAAARRDRVAQLCEAHRYQMNEVGRCVDVLPALGMIAAVDDRPIALVDLGTGAGLGLHLDRYRYTYTASDGSARTVGDPAAPVRLSCVVARGSAAAAAVGARARRPGRDRRRAARPHRSSHTGLARRLRPSRGGRGHAVRGSVDARPRRARAEGARQPARRAARRGRRPPARRAGLPRRHLCTRLPAPSGPRPVRRPPRADRPRARPRLGIGRPPHPARPRRAAHGPAPRRPPRVDRGEPKGRRVRRDRTPPDPGRGAHRTVLGRAHPGAAWLEWTGSG